MSPDGRRDRDHSRESLELARTARWRCSRGRSAVSCWRALGVGVLALLVGVAPLLGAPPAGARFRPLPVPGHDLTIVPESERALQRVVIGVQRNVTRYFMLPSTERWDPRSWNPRVAFFRRQLYWLNLELSHGRILSVLPRHSRIFAAVPDPALSGSLGNEREVFEDYLRTRAGWPAEDVAERVRYYTVAEEVPYPQDLAELLGRDSRGRLVLGLGDDGDPYYLEPTRRLAAAFPGDFLLKPLAGVNTEGGDIELVWLPEGVPGLIVGRHRALRRLGRMLGEGVIGRAVTEKELERLRSRYRRAFFGLEVLIVGEAGLRRPRLVSDELFHMDMVVNVMRVGERALAFIPSYEGEAVDAHLLEPLSPELISRAQAEYDMVARQLRQRGYTIVRLPLADHPVRSPVNVARFVSPTGRPTVLLGRYPYHRKVDGGRSPQHHIQSALDGLVAASAQWHSTPSDANWERLRQALAHTWSMMDSGVAAPNPTFALQAGTYRANGVDVIPVPMFAAGEGGLHCSLLN